MKKIAIIGSSGGNLYNQGGSDPYGMMKEIFVQADSAGIEVAYIQFIGTSRSMDNISEDAKARLFTLSGEREVVESEEKKLSQINELALKHDAKLKEMIEADEIDGIMLMSCDPKGVNREALKAASVKKIPIAGTGGTSMAEVQAMGCHVIAASGTTGTTNRTRAISAIASFSKEWHIKFSPVVGGGSREQQQGSVWKRINFRGIMMASMPGFIAMALTLALSKVPSLESISSVFDMLIGTLPIILAAIAAKQVSGLDEVGVVAGIVAGAMAVNGGIIGGLISGIIAGVLAYYIITLCFKYKVPGTTSNIAAGGISGLIAGFVGMFAIAPVSLWMGDSIKLAIDAALGYNAVLAGAVAGFAIWFAIMGGVYHAAILPIVLLEMEQTGYSFLGSIDMMGLVMVCAGIQLANIIRPRTPADRVASMPNLFINLAFGTFVEAAYPYMFSSKKVFAGAILSSTISGIAVGYFGVKGTAYVPAFVAPLMANEGKSIAFAICMLIAVGVSAAITIFANITEKKAIEA